ncbi:hypothetical protein TNCV_2604451 [Trichonephila clavipes]|nr:hypothetical protein TNCV_2604451 [Trichonephila clavipes]
MGLYSRWLTHGPQLTKRHCQLFLQSGLGNIKTGPWISRRELLVVVLCFENVLMGGPGILKSNRKHHKTCGQFERNFGYMASIFPTGNCIFQQDNFECHKVRINVEWCERHDDELQLVT